MFRKTLSQVLQALKTWWNTHVVSEYPFEGDL
jgi:hypothetical protein